MHILELFSLIIVSTDRQNMKNKGKTSLIVILNMHMTVRFVLLVIFSANEAIVDCRTDTTISMQRNGGKGDAYDYL